MAQAGGNAIAGATETDQRFDVVCCAGVDASIPAADSGEDPESVFSDDAVWEPSQEPKSSSRRTKGSTKNGEWRERNRQAQKAFRQRQKVAVCRPCSLRPPPVQGPCEKAELIQWLIICDFMLGSAHGEELKHFLSM